MKNMPDVKIGIVTCCTDWMPSEIAVKTVEKIFKLYDSKYGTDSIYNCSVIITDNEVNIKRALRELTKAECTAVCLLYANYGPSSAGTLFAKEFDGPIMFIASAEEDQDSYYKDRRDALSGFLNACYALKLRNTNVYIPTKPCGTYLQCADMIYEFISISRTLYAIKNLKLIAFGPRPSSFLGSSAPNHLLYDLGIEISEYSELELFDFYRKHEGDYRIEKIVEEMKQELDKIQTPEILNELAKLEVTIEDWIKNYKGNKKYVTLTSTCRPAFPVNFGFVPCYVHSRLTAKGYPVACEVDEYGAVSKYIGQCVSNDVVAFVDVNNNIPLSFYENKIKGKKFNGKSYEIGDLFLGYHCGTTAACKLVSPKLDYHFINKQLSGEENTKGTIQGSIISGDITIFRLQGMRDGKLRAYVAQGQVLPVTMDTYGGQGIIAVPQMERFIRNVMIKKQFPNHCVVLFGHYGKILTSVLRQLGISEIYYNHPIDIPYDGESIFDNTDDWF